MQLDAIFTHGAVRHLGGARFFERGAAYAASGRVRKLKVDDEAVTATVRGNRVYQVRLWAEDGGPVYSCTCPVGEEGRVYTVPLRRSRCSALQSRQLALPQTGESGHEDQRPVPRIDPVGWPPDLLG